MTRPSRQKWLLVLVGILLVTNLVTLSIFYFKPSGPRPGNNNQRSRMGKFIVDQMKFDSTQEAAYWSMRDSMIEKQRPVWDSIRTAKKKFFDLVNQPGASDSILRSRADEVMAYQKKLDSITLRHFQLVRTLVHPNQVQKFDTVIQEIVNRMTPQRRPNNSHPGDKKDSALKK